jgi:prepilin-type N-terminal cleavage/methylation domain-containing protein
MGSLVGKETMLTSSAGATSKLSPERGITLLEMLIVVSLIGLLTALSYPSVTAGLDTLRLRSASDVVVTFLSSALDRAERRQSVVEVQILPADNVLLARTADLAFNKRVDLPEGMHIVSVTPEIPGADAKSVRRFLIYPGGAVPQVSVEITNPKGRSRIVSIDPLTGSARATEVVK